MSCAAIQAWRDAANDYARIQLVKQYFLCVEGQLLSQLGRPYPFFMSEAS